MTLRPRVCAAWLAFLLGSAPLLFPAPTMQTVTLPSSPHSGHISATRRHRFTVNLPCANAFILFEPIGEKLWAEGWDPVFATPSDANLHAGSVFTRTAGPSGQTQTSVWQITVYAPAEGRIEYRVVYPRERVQRIAVECRPMRAAVTAVEVTYDYTGLSEEGDRFIADMTPEKFQAFIGEWDTAIRAYLARGTPASP